MMAAYPKYESYKDSGIEWVGQIPLSWEIIPNKYLFKLCKTQVGKKSSEYDLLSLTLRGIVKRNIDSPEGKFPADFDSYQEVRPGNFVFCHFDVEETPRTVGLSTHYGMITGAYTVYDPVISCDEIFLYYFYLNADTDKRLRSLYKGLRNTIPKDSFAAFRTPLPPLPEQRAIAAFLDKKCERIDEAVRIKEEQIALLKERRQILIQQAVTRGLNPDAPMKDSGIDWIGEIPAHWGVLRNFALLDEIKTPGNANLPVLSVSIHHGVSREELSDEDNIRSIIKIEDRSSYKEVRPGDIAYNMMRAWQGGIGAVHTHGMVSPAYVVARPIDSLIGEYFELLYRTPAFIRQMDSHSKGITDFRKRLYWDDFRSCKTILPPKAEQQQIIEYQNGISAKTDKAITLKQSQIATLKEYKTCLINAAVTGKIKVI
jgi:type I restriction enzyme S subunit